MNRTENYAEKFYIASRFNNEYRKNCTISKKEKISKILSNPRLKLPERLSDPPFGVSWVLERI